VETAGTTDAKNPAFAARLSTASGRFVADMISGFADVVAGIREEIRDRLLPRN